MQLYLVSNCIFILTIMTDPDLVDVIAGYAHVQTGSRWEEQTKIKWKNAIATASSTGTLLGNWKGVDYLQTLFV